jgi:TrmH family RNA methyltransferase
MTVPDGGPPNPNSVAPVPSPNLAGCTIILVRTQGPINLGMVARVCGNMGVNDLRLVAPIAEVNCEDSRKFSTHSRDLLLSARIFPDLASAVADCQLVIGTSARFRDSELGSSLAPHEVPALLTVRPAERWALVFGNEADGLDTRELRCCQAWVHLETFGDNSSYNLANAVAITTYVIATAGIPPVRGENEPGAPREAVSALYDYWLATLDRIRYFRRADVERFRPMLTRMLSRWHLTMTDVQALRGMLAQVNYHAFGRRFDRLDLEATEPKEPEPEPPAGPG